VECKEQNKTLKRRHIDERRARDERIRVQAHEIERLRLEISTRNGLANVKRDQTLQSLEQSRDQVL
jgi:hypothetical protein